MASSVVINIVKDLTLVIGLLLSGYIVTILSFLGLYLWVGIPWTVKPDNRHLWMQGRDTVLLFGIAPIVTAIGTVVCMFLHYLIQLSWQIVFVVQLFVSMLGGLYVWLM